MRPRDTLRYALGSLGHHRSRSLLTALGIAVGIAAVVVLTAIGEGARTYVIAQFTQFGTHLIAVSPGRTSTHGVTVGVFGTVRPLTLEDARALRGLPGIEGVVPFVQGNAEIKAGGRVRRTQVLGVGADLPKVFALRPAMGRFLPPDGEEAARPHTVLGATVRRELFPDSSPLGAVVRIAGERYRVIGVMEAKGNVLGIELDDAVYVPAARALTLFGREGLMEIDVLYRAGLEAETVADRIRRLLSVRHGREDFTITTQDRMLEVLDSVLRMLTFAVGAIGGVSLLVGTVGVLTIMLIAVAERRSEIGILRALGARRSQIAALFLTEAMMLATLGGAAGLALGAGLAAGLHALVPALPVRLAWMHVLLAETLATAAGLAGGLLPALRAAALPPTEALRSG